MPAFSAPMINLYSRDLPRAAAFYSELGFVETFRTPESGEPVHIEFTLDGFTLGIATIEAAQEHHGLRPEGEGRWIEIVLWTDDDTDAALNALVTKSARLLSPAHDFLDGKLRAAWIADPDGNPYSTGPTEKLTKTENVIGYRSGDCWWESAPPRSLPRSRWARERMAIPSPRPELHRSRD